MDWQAMLMEKLKGGISNQINAQRQQKQGYKGEPGEPPAEEAREAQMSPDEYAKKEQEEELLRALQDAELLRR